MPSGRRPAESRSARALRAHLRRAAGEPRLRRQWITFALTAALTPFALVGTPGYENALALSGPMSLLGAAVGVDTVARLRLTPRGPRDTSVLGAAARSGLAELAWLLALSLAVLLVALAWRSNCDLLEGLGFFAIGPASSAVLGWVCGLWGGLLARARPVQLTLALAPIVWCLGVSLLRLYRDPVVFAFDPFWGHFAGPLYDEAVSITPRLRWFRVYNALAAAAALGAFYLSTTRRALDLVGRLKAHPLAAILTVVGAVGALSFGLRPAHHGFTATVSSLSRALAGVHETEHFVLHFTPHSRVAADIEMIAAEHEFAHAELRAQLQRAPEGKTHSFIFNGPEHKRRLMGAGRTEVAPPWRGHLYLNHQRYPHRSLTHELAHAFSATVGDPVFGISGAMEWTGPRVNLALVEGFATALAPRPRDDLDLHDQAAVLDRIGKRPELAGIMGLGFWGQASRRAYTAAGSFCLWLLETRGVEPLARLYASGGDFPATYGQSLAALERGWVAFLATRTLSERAIEAARERFRRRSIFRRPCAHRAANLRREALVARSRGQLADSRRALDALCSIEPQQPAHRLLLASSQVQVGADDEALATLTAAAALPGLTDPVAALIEERIGDLALLAGALEVARLAYARAARRGIGEARLRTLELKRLSTLDPDLARKIADYFTPFDPAPDRSDKVIARVHAAMTIADDPRLTPLSAYLTGRQLLAAGRPELAAPRFERSLDPGTGEHPLPSASFVRAARLALVECRARLRDYERARAELELLAADPQLGSGQRLAIARWQRRLTFLREYRPTGG